MAQPPEKRHSAFDGAVPRRTLRLAGAAAVPLAAGRDGVEPGRELDGRGRARLAGGGGTERVAVSARAARVHPRHHAAARVAVRGRDSGTLRPAAGGGSHPGPARHRRGDRRSTRGHRAHRHVADVSAGGDRRNGGRDQRDGAAGAGLRRRWRRVHRQRDRAERRCGQRLADHRSGSRRRCHRHGRNRRVVLRADGVLRPGHAGDVRAAPDHPRRAVAHADVPEHPRRGLVRARRSRRWRAWCC